MRLKKRIQKLNFFIHTIKFYSYFFELLFCVCNLNVKTDLKWKAEFNPSKKFFIYCFTKKNYEYERKHSDSKIWCGQQIA